MSTKAHAEHNRDVCDFLLAKTSFHDWVITTAFYAALHFVQSKIFPFVEDGQTFTNIDDYLTFLEQKTGKRISKHQATIKLVNKKMPAIRAEYRKLHDTCMTARYFQYKVQLSMAVDAKNELTLIEDTCK